MREDTVLLFFDDARLNRRDNLVRRIGQPELVPEGTFLDPHVNIPWGYPSVFRDQQSGVWRCLYLGHGERKRYPLLAESADGIQWQVPDLHERAPLPGRELPHQVLPLERFGEWPACYVDETAEDPAERIKGLVVYHTAKNHLRTCLWVSPDGLRWRLCEGVEWQPSELAPDPGVCAFWNAVRGSYVFTTRPMWTDRRIAVFETKDWRTFSQPELALQADALDSPLAELYGMPVFPYAGLYIALLWLYHVAPAVEGLSPHKFYDGKVDCQLAYSANGWHFQRALREPFLPHADVRPGEYGAGCIYPSSLVEHGAELRIYSSASTLEHGHRRAGSGAILLHRLRRDGFVYLESTGGIGTLGTRGILWHGGEVKLNVEAPAGEVRVQVTDTKGQALMGYAFADCVPFTGDALEWTPEWKEKRVLSALGEQTLRLEVQLNNGRIYSIRGPFAPLVAGEVWRYEEEGLLPFPRPGF